MTFLGGVAHDRAYLLIAGGQNVTADDDAVKTFRGSFRFGTNVPPPGQGNTGGPKPPGPSSGGGDLDAALRGTGLSEAEAKQRLQVIIDLNQLAFALQIFCDNTEGPLPPADGSGVSPRNDNSRPKQYVGVSWRALVAEFAFPMPAADADQTQAKIQEIGKELERFKTGDGKAQDQWNVPYFKTLRLRPHGCPIEGKTVNGWDTFFRVFVGTGAAFEPGRRVSFRDFTDGTSNTLLIVEAGAAVPWPKPEELAYDASKPLPKLGGLFPDGFYAVFADSKVRFIKNGTDEKTIRAWIMRNGGEAVELPPVVDTKAMRRAAGYKD